jgi:serine/threonine protein kinase
LQQQNLMVDRTEGHRRLNMNFVRLTWHQMLSAVHCIHEARIIHSDLKPANFLFVRGALKLIDFGIAKAIQSDDTNNIYRDSQIGTLNYMSPEAILDSGGSSDKPKMKLGRVRVVGCGIAYPGCDLRLTHTLFVFPTHQASDIWSLGCILYQMVYGKTPFADLQMIQKLQAIINPKHRINFPDDVEQAAREAMQACLRRSPEDRPPIVGTDGLLNENLFLNPPKQQLGSS